MIKLIVIFLIIIILYYIYIDSQYAQKYKKIIYESFDLKSEEENIKDEEIKTINNYENSKDFKLYYYNYEKRKYNLYDDVLKQNIINSIKIKKDNKIILYNKENKKSNVENNGYSTYRVEENTIVYNTKNRFIKIMTEDNKLIFFEYDKYRNILIKDNENNNIGYILKNKGKILIQNNYKKYIQYIFLALIISIYG
jgi:hypothetical protein